MRNLPAWRRVAVALALLCSAAFSIQPALASPAKVPVVQSETGKPIPATAVICVDLTGAYTGCSGGGGGGGSSGGTATAAAPTYTEGATGQPLSLNLTGDLRTINKQSGTWTVNQGGTWTVQPGNTANTTAWLVTGTGGTFPATQSGTWNLNNISGTISLPTGAATSSLQTTGNTSLSTIATNTTNAGTPQLAAGENHGGEVGGNQITITAAQTVTASSAYTSGNAVGGLVTISGAARVSGSSGAGGTSGLIQSVVVNSKSAQTGQLDVIFFSANPSGSTCTDKSAVSIAAADFDKVIGVAHVTDWTSLGTPSIGQAQNMAMPYALTSSTTLYACVVTRSTPTFSATTDISVSFRLLRN